MQGSGQHADSPARAPTTAPEPQRYFVDHQFDEPAHLTTTLAHALSDVSGIDVSAVQAALWDHVDPRALDRIFRPKPDGTARGGSSISFTVYGYHVTVFGTGRIEIVPSNRPRA